MDISPLATDPATRSLHDTNSLYDPFDNSDYDLPEIPSEKSRIVREDFAKDPEDFQVKKDRFVEDSIPYWIDKIDFALRDFSENAGVEFEQVSEEAKQNMARLLAHYDLGIKITSNRYHPLDAEAHRELKFSTALDEELKMENIFRYSHYEQNPDMSMILVNLHWLITVSQDPEKWYQNLKDNKGFIGPVHHESLAELIIFAGVEEAAHDIYLNHTDAFYPNRLSPENDEFYYAENWEFQALKVMYFFAKKYFPDRMQDYKDQMVHMIEHRRRSKDSASGVRETLSDN